MTEAWSELHDSWAVLVATVSASATPLTLGMILLGLIPPLLAIGIGWLRSRRR